MHDGASSQLHDCRVSRNLPGAAEGVRNTARRLVQRDGGDVGSYHDIHPKQKRPVGQRLALFALNHIYGEAGLLCEAPLVQDCSFDNGELVLRFRFGQSLHRSSDAPLPLTVSVEGQTLEESRELDVTVKDNTLRIRAERFDLSRWEACPWGKIHGM